MEVSSKTAKFESTLVRHNQFYLRTRSRKTTEQITCLNSAIFLGYVDMLVYDMDKGILLGTKTLVALGTWVAYFPYVTLRSA